MRWALLDLLARPKNGSFYLIADHYCTIKSLPRWTNYKDLHQTLSLYLSIVIKLVTLDVKYSRHTQSSLADDRIAYYTLSYGLI